MEVKSKVEFPVRISKGIPSEAGRKAKAHIQP